MAQTIVNYLVNGSNPVTVGGTGTTPKAFFNIPGPSIGVNNSTPSFGVSSTNLSNATGQMNVPGSGRLNGQIFHVQAAGNFEVGSGGACPNVTIALYANTGTVTTPVTTKIATTGAITTQALTGVFYPWYMDVTLMGDTSSGIVQGSFVSQVDGTAVTSNTLSANLSGVNFTTSEPAFGLVMAITFSVSESGNSANLFSFQLTA